MSTPGKSPMEQFLDKDVEEAVEPFRGLLPADVLDGFADAWRDAVHTEPVLEEMANQLCPNPAPENNMVSDDVEKGVLNEAEVRRRFAEEAAKAGGDGGGVVMPFRKPPPKR